MTVNKSYEVHLEMFEGPLDLLLYLIKKNDLDIQNIPIAKITQEYLSYIEIMKELNLEVVGDFLVMASTLMQIKARSLLPSQAGLEDEGPDPRSELVAKLVEYQKFKQAASFLSSRADQFQGIFYRGAPRFQEREKSLDIRIFDLLSTLKEILDRAEDDGRVITGEEYSIEEKMSKILKMVEENPYVTLRQVFDGERKRRAILTCFLALLELIKLQQIFARQGDAFGEILVYKKETPPETVAPIWPGFSDPAIQGGGAPEGGAAGTPVVEPGEGTEPGAAADAPGDAVGGDAPIEPGPGGGEAPSA